MKPYSLDLRERVLAAIEHHEGSQAKIAGIFRVSLSFVAHLVQRYRRTGNFQPQPHGGGRQPALDHAARQHLCQLVQEQPDATLKELRQRLGIPCSLMAIWRALRDLKITRKKKVLHAQERDSPRVQKQRRAFDQEVAQIDPQHLVFVDECGASTAMTRTYGRAPRGQRVEGAVPGHWQTVTLISGMRLSEVVAPWVFVGTTDTAAFQTYVSEVLVPELGPGDVVIWDNLKPHKQIGVVEAVQHAGATVRSLPPYSPDKTPIEKLYSKAKKVLRDLGARTIPTVVQAVGTALKAIQPEDIAGWFHSCGIVLNQT